MCLFITFKVVISFLCNCSVFLAVKRGKKQKLKVLQIAEAQKHAEDSNKLNVNGQKRPREDDVAPSKSKLCIIIMTSKIFVHVQDM